MGEAFTREISKTKQIKIVRRNGMLIITTVVCGVHVNGFTINATQFGGIVALE